jgi:osmotically-inducible protein OsmY
MRRFARSPLLAAILLPLAALALQGCAGLAVGAGAVGGIAVLEDRSLADQARDEKIYWRVIGRWIEHDDGLPLKLGLEVYEARVLLTGVVPDEQMRADAVRIASGVEGVQEVLNEIVVGDSDLLDRARDTRITLELRSDITFDKQIYAINYSITTVGATIYLIGKARSQAELDRVIAHARAIDSVRNIVNHVTVKQASS